MHLYRIARLGASVLMRMNAKSPSNTSPTNPHTTPIAIFAFLDSLLLLAGQFAASTFTSVEMPTLLAF